MEQTQVLTAAGDVFMPGTVRWSNGDFFENDKESSKHIIDKVAPFFLKSDINFCNIESPISDKGKPAAGRAAAFRSYPDMANILQEAGINIVALANNHSQDYGWEALKDTMTRLEQQGISHSGAGENLAGARRPALVEKNGMKVGLLSYTANVNTPMGFKASDNRQGLNPMRISAYFLPDQVNMEDIEVMENDIRILKEAADFIIISCHWGISEGGTHTVTRHQEVIAHHAIDAGADLVVGHHPHALQPIEIYKDKPIAYSLGNFIFSLEEDMPRETMMFQCVFSKHNIHEIRFLPCYINDRNQPEVFPLTTENGTKVVSLMRKLCDRYNVKLTENMKTGEVVCSQAGS